MQVNNFAGGRGEVAGGAGVVLHVAAAHGAARVHILKLGEDLMRSAADGVDHHVEPTAMAHGEDRAVDAILRRGGEELVEEGNQNGESLQREAFGAEITLLDHLLEKVGANQAGEDARAAERRRALGRFGLQPLLDPRTALRRGNVHELRADGAAVDLARCLGVSAVRRGRGKRLGRKELSERIERGLQISPAAEGVEDAVSRAALRVDFCGLELGLRLCGRVGRHSSFMLDLLLLHRHAAFDIRCRSAWQGSCRTPPLFG